MESVGITGDPLTARQAFMSRHQGASKAVKNYVTDLKKLFKESYPDESQMSPNLLERFLTGLSLPICHQLLLKGKPSALE